MFGTRAGVRAAAVSLALLTLLACGAEDGDAPESASADPSAPGSAQTSASPSAEVPPEAPACAEVWQEGARLPRGYQGCVEGDAFVPRDVIGCSSGQRLARHDDAFYGVLGGSIHQVEGGLEQDRDYRAAVRSCRA